MAAFGERRIYYNNFAAHLLNAYNPNMLYPDLPHRWSDADWKSCIDMVADFGYNVFEFWLVPHLFSRESLESPLGDEFARQVNVICAHARERGMLVEMMAGLATTTDFRTLCPNQPDEWQLIRELWDGWTRRLPDLGIVGIFPGDPGGCSLNGCTAETYIDKSVEIAELVRKNIPSVEIDFNTWGPPFFAWGNIEGPEGWNNEFVQEFQHTAWRSDPERTARSMQHLIDRLPDFPDETHVSINMGFNPDSKPEGAENALPWAQRIAETHRIQTWDFSLTEGEGAIIPHYRFRRLFEQRRRERSAAPYSGGICFTMTPKLNQLSLYMAAQSFLDPDADEDTVAADFFEKVFGSEGRVLAHYIPCFEVVPDWGNYDRPDMDRATLHRRMNELIEILEGFSGESDDTVPFLPTVGEYRNEILWFATFFASLSGKSPDYDLLRTAYWKHVYGIYDSLPRHPDDRPGNATDRMIDFFRNDLKEVSGPADGAWTETQP